jgi:hypothetical protein
MCEFNGNCAILATDSSPHFSRCGIWARSIHRRIRTLRTVRLPVPPPKHLVTTTSFTPRRLPSRSACPKSRSFHTGVRSKCSRRSRHRTPDRWGVWRDNKVPGLRTPRRALAGRCRAQRGYVASDSWLALPAVVRPFSRTGLSFAIRRARTLDSRRTSLQFLGCDEEIDFA